jgi:hypothetical protein
LFNLKSNPLDKHLMKSHRTLKSLVALFISSLAFAALGAEQKKENAAEWAELFGGASLPVVWQSASAASEKIDAALAARKLDGVASWAETIHLASHALEDQVKVDDPERAKRLKGALAQVAKIADDMMDAANHNEAEKTADAQRRLKAALALAKSRMPKEILEAPKQEPRFAKFTGHAHGEKETAAEKKK